MAVIGVERAVLKCFGLGRGEVSEIIREAAEGLNDVVVTPYEVGPEIHIHLVAQEGGSLKLARDRMVSLLGDDLYGSGDETLETVVAGLLTDRRATVAVAESLTGGLICDRLTDVPGSSLFFMRGYVVYSNDAKVKLLSVPADTIEEKGAVSGEVARLMAEGAKREAVTTYGISVTGIAGPTGGRPGKPVGTVYGAVAGPGETWVEHRLFPGSRRAIKLAISAMALDMLRRYLLRG